MQVNLILSVDNDGYIGTGSNDLCVKSRIDLNHFKNMTNGKTVLMGLNTFKSLPNDLHNRRMIIISSTAKREDVRGHEVYRSIKEALMVVKAHDIFETVYIIGGKYMFEDGIHYAKNVYLTRFDSYCDNGNVKLSIEFIATLFREFNRETLCLISEEESNGSVLDGVIYKFSRKVSTNDFICMDTQTQTVKPFEFFSQKSPSYAYQLGVLNV
jgi:dihydrofolate reductase